jgi:hypothetical protein
MAGVWQIYKIESMREPMNRGILLLTAGAFALLLTVLVLLFALAGELQRVQATGAHARWYMVTLTPTATPTPTITVTPTLLPPAGDPYEVDDSCDQAKPIDANGTAQFHTLHQSADQDWLRLSAMTNTTHLITARPLPTATTELTLMLTTECAAAPALPPTAITATQQLTFTAAISGYYYLQVIGQKPISQGVESAYRLTVQEIPRRPGALVIVAARLQNDDPLQSMIHTTTNRIYQLWRSRGYAADEIRYLASDLTLDADHDGQSDITGLASRANLSTTLTQWAAEKVSADQPLTLYLVDHSAAGEQFTLDAAQQEIVTVQMLDQWLDQLELAAPGAPINIIIEACFGGKLIDLPHSVSGANRVVISSSSAEQMAYASERGPLFSELFLSALAQEESLADAFAKARHAVGQGPQDPQPWLDDNGDGLANTAADGKLAQSRGLAPPGSAICGRTLVSCEGLAPQIVQIEMQPTVDQRHAITATVQDNTGVQAVWVVVYSPGYQPPLNGDALAQGPASRLLQSQGENRYSLLTEPLTKPGLYRLVFYAEDEESLLAAPNTRFVRSGDALFLPLVGR